jgi:histidine triad (HIT) family protein
MVPDCIFCQIVAGTIPSDRVAESSNVLAFRDINPVAPTHVLLIPKDHVVDSAADIRPEHGAILAEIFGMAAEIAAAEGLDDGWKLVTNVGAAAGQTVFHAHFHLIGGWHRPLPTPDAESA